MKLYYPVDKIYITQKFGENGVYYSRYGMEGHNGVDLRTRFDDSPDGKRPMHASADGTVYDVRFDKVGYGRHVRIRHADGSITLYGHMSEITVKEGQKVKAKEQIGITGNTGDSTGPHVHWEYRPAGWESNTDNGYYGAVDPLPFAVEWEHNDYDPSLTERLKGHLLLQVQENGELWYVTTDGKKEYLGTKEEEYQKFMERVRTKKIPALGITNDDLNKIP